MTTALSTGIRRVATRLAPDPTPDGELLSRFLSSRDEAAFAVLVRRHAGMVFGTCRRVLGNAPDADDAFQAAFVVLVRKAHSLTDRACVGNYLYGVAFHTALKARAMATKRRAKEAKASRERERPESDEVSRVLDEELANLPEKYREPVVLCELEGVSRRDAAVRLGIPEGTISSRLATAHRMLEKRLKARGFATACLTAVLGNQAFAVSDSLADAAVRAATSGAPAGITQLAAEVTKMFLLNKVRAGAALLAGVVLMLGVGAGVVLRGTAAENKPVRKAPVLPKKEAEKTDEERIRGTWVMSEIKQVGVMPTDEQRKKWASGGFNITFTADEMIYEVDKSRVKYRLDPLKDPKQVQLLDGDTVVALGLYELMGDDLKVCIGRKAEKGMQPVAPTGFDPATQPNTFPTLLVMKRAKPEQKDEDLIQGLWQAEGLEAGGQTAPDAAVEKFQVRFKGDKITFVADDRTHTFELDATAKPKALNLTPGDGAAKGKKLECAIYDLDGDTLKICMDKEGLAGKRPTEFKTAPGDGFALIVLKRVKEKAKPAEKKPEIDKSYSLKDGEVLKLIPAPFPVGRDAVFQLAGDRHPFQSADGCLMAVTVGKGQGGPESAHPFTNRRTPGADTQGKSLASFLEYGLRIDLTKVADPDGLLESTVLDADVVLKKGAAPNDLLAALRKELKAKCGVDLVLEFRDAETQVVVISGTHTLKADPPADATRPYDTAPEVHLFAGQKHENPNGSHGDTGRLPTELARFLGRPVIDESDLTKNKVLVTTRTHERHPATAKTRAEDRDPEKVLQNLANQTGLTFKLGKQKVRALVVEKANAEPAKKEEAKKPVEPAWKAEFRKAYGLKDGELVRRVAPPYPDCREEYFNDLYKRAKGGGPGLGPADWFVVLGWKDDWTHDGLGGTTMPIKPDLGVSLERLLDMTLKVPKTRIESDRTTLDRKVTGDFVVRAGAEPEKVAVQLETILRKELELPVKFSFKDAEEEVFVLSGKYEAKPLDDRKADQIEVFAKHLTERTTGGGGSGTLTELVAAIERHVSKPIVVGKIENRPGRVSWHYNVRQPMLRDPAKGIDTYTEDTNAPTVLYNIAQQTGLTVTTEKRKVRTLVVEHVEVKK